MINGLEGIPGSGKSYEAVVYHVLHYLKAGRRVITNLPLDLERFAAIDPAYVDLIELRTKSQKVLGTWDPDRTPAFLCDATQQDAEWNPEFMPEAVRGSDGRYFGSAKIRRSNLFGSVWDFYSDWRSPDGMGPVFIIDECHVGMPKIGTSAQVIEWYKLHRHFNIDVLLMTQSFRDVCPEISGILGMVIKVRKADILGKKDSYIRKVQSGYRGAVISTDERKYQPQYFPLYKSHTQGSSLAEVSSPDVKPMIVGFNRLKWVIFAIGFLILGGVWYSASHNKPYAQQTKPYAAISQAQPQAVTQVVAAAAPAPGASASLPGAVVAPGELPEPYETKSIHMTGWAKMGQKEMYTFAIGQNGLIVAAVTDADLVRSGYRWMPTGHCTGAVIWHDKARAVSCDAPQVSMAMAGEKSAPSPQ